MNGSSDVLVGVVSGAADGIGRAVARALAQSGTAVVVADLRSDAVAAELASETGAAVVGMPVDVTDSAAVRGRFGRADHLVDCAGMSLSSLTAEHPDDDWRRMLELNLTGTFLMCREFSALLAASRGTVVNVSSGGNGPRRASGPTRSRRAAPTPSCCARSARTRPRRSRCGWSRRRSAC